MILAICNALEDILEGVEFDGGEAALLEFDGLRGVSGRPQCGDGKVTSSWLSCSVVTFGRAWLDWPCPMVTGQRTWGVGELITVVDDVDDVDGVDDGGPSKLSAKPRVTRLTEMRRGLTRLTQSPATHPSPVSAASSAVPRPRV